MGEFILSAEDRLQTDAKKSYGRYLKEVRKLRGNLGELLRPSALRPRRDFGELKKRFNLLDHTVSKLHSIDPVERQVQMEICEGLDEAKKIIEEIQAQRESRIKRNRAPADVAESQLMAMLGRLESRIAILAHAKAKGRSVHRDIARDIVKDMVELRKEIVVADKSEEARKFGSLAKELSDLGFPINFAVKY